MLRAFITQYGMVWLKTKQQSYILYFQEYRQLLDMIREMSLLQIQE